MASTEPNKKLIADDVEALGAHDFDRAEELSDPKWIEHVPGAPSGGLERLRPGAELFFAAFSDWTPTIAEQISEGDMVFTRVRWHGRHTSEFLGVPASGREATLEVFRLDRITDGKLVETRFMYDLQDFLSRLRP